MDAQLFEKFSYAIFRVAKDYFIFASVTFFLFYVVLRKPMWFRKIQQKMPSFNDYRRDVLYSLVSIIISAITIVLTFYIGRDYNNVYRDIDQYSTVYYLFTFVWMFFVHDTYFYWMHRAMHHPLLFKRVHLIHHKSTNPSPWTAYAFHPFEAIAESCILPIIAFTLPVHISAVIFFFVFQISYNVYGHLGFEILPKGFHKTRIGRLMNTSTAHNIHHLKFKGNYGLYSLIWDRLMGTVREDYDATYEKVTSRPKNEAEQSEVIVAQR
jgi:sterol desaturase/sphingolipid hydroxylase (fatty acid hydroxylase superfamily)